MRHDATLTVWLYDSAMGAAAGQVRLRDLQLQGALTVHDAVTVTWVPGTHEPRLGHLRYETTAVASRGSVLGALLGSLVLDPATGATGSGVGTLARRLRGTGIDREFLEKVSSRLHPGTSALVVLSSNANLDAVQPVLERGRARGDVTLMFAELVEGAPEVLEELLQVPAPRKPLLRDLRDPSGPQRA